MDWRKLLQWLDEDGVVSPAEAQRTIACCAQIQSAQHPVARLAEVERQSRRNVHLRVADLLEISKFTAEFFALARSGNAALNASGGAASFEQLVALNKNSRPASPSHW